MKYRLIAFGVAAFAAVAAVHAAGGKDEKKPTWDVAAPPLPTRQVPINVDEGTWMNVDVSPDGRTIAFDLLGDIYTVPITGGKATRLTSGMAYDIHPVYSPDGKKIIYV